ncbi:MAG TPA: S8 family serine peptidase [Candidatus Eisenbacteria bacterium]
MIGGIRPRPGRRARALALALGFAAAGALPAGAAGGDLAGLAKLAPGLIAARESMDTMTVWVSFADKGEPAELAAALGAARASLTPRALARRERAGVRPLVDERDVPVPARDLEALAALGLRPFAVSRWLNRAAVRVPGTRLAEVASLPCVGRLAPVESARVSPDPARAAAAPPPERAALPGAAAAIAYGRTAAALAQLDVAAFHDSGYAGAGVLVCILDEGFNGHDTHEALRDHVIAPGFQRDFVDGDWDVTSPGNDATFFHGSAVMGCLGGSKPGTYVGPAFAATFALGRTEIHSAEKRVEMLYWGLGAEWADSLGADIISSSLGYSEFDAPDADYTYADMNGHTTDISRYAEIAASKGILVVNAVGNEGNKTWHFLVAPADVKGDSLIAVGAVDGLGRPAAFSSFGPSADGRIKPDLAAPGVFVPAVYVPLGAQGYDALDGTSLATPFVAGLAACLMQARPAWRPVDIIRALRETASQASRPDNRVGYGVPRGGRAMCWRPPGSGEPSLPDAVPAAQLLGPNPARAGGPPARVRFAAGGFIPGPSPARIRVFDLVGRRVRDVWSGALARGQCLTVSWDGRNDDGHVLHSGFYYVSLEVGGEVTTARVAWLR